MDVDAGKPDTNTGTVENVEEAPVAACINCDDSLLSEVCAVPKLKPVIPAGLTSFGSVLPVIVGSRSRGLAWLLLAGL